MEKWKRTEKIRKLRTSSSLSTSAAYLFPFQKISMVMQTRNEQVWMKQIKRSRLIKADDEARARFVQATTENRLDTTKTADDT